MTGRSKAGPRAILLSLRTERQTIFIQASINAEGAFVVEGQDIGQSAQSVFGDSDYEYWLVVAPQDKPALMNTLATRAKSEKLVKNAKTDEQKDMLLLALVMQAYKGSPTVVGDLTKWLTAHKIPYKFSSF